MGKRNRLAGKTALIAYENIPYNFMEYMSEGTFFNSLDLPNNTKLIKWHIAKKSSDFIVYHISLNKKSSFSLRHFTITLNKKKYTPRKLLAKMFEKPIVNKTHIKYNYDRARYKCVSLLFDKTPLFYVHKNYPDDLLNDFMLHYKLKTDLKHISCHFSKDGIVFSFEYTKKVRYYTHPRQPLRTSNGYCKLLHYNLTADPADCVNTCLIHQGVVRYDVSLIKTNVNN